MNDYETENGKAGQQRLAANRILWNKNKCDSTQSVYTVQQADANRNASMMPIYLIKEIDQA